MVDEIPDFCMPMIWVKKKDSNICSLITEIMPEYVYVVFGGGHSMKDLFEDYTYLDGSPCGKVEE